MRLAEESVLVRKICDISDNSVDTPIVLPKREKNRIGVARNLVFGGSKISSA